MQRKKRGVLGERERASLRPKAFSGEPLCQPNYGTNRRGRGWIKRRGSCRGFAQSFKVAFVIFG